MQQVPGEAAIPQQVQQQVAPDAAGAQGQAQLFQKAISAHVAKKQLDAVLQAVSDKIGATMSTRVKQIETATAKVAQKKLEGQDYGVNDINDMLGGRIVVKNEADIAKAKKALDKLGEAGIYTINKKESVKKGTYGAFHYDVTMNNGLQAEIQIHTPQSEAEAVTNHDLRAVHGENPSFEAVKTLRNKQADIISSLPNDKAQAITQAVQGLRTQNKNQPLPPQLTASLLAQAQGSGVRTQ